MTPDDAGTPDDAALEYVSDHLDITRAAPGRRTVTDPSVAADELGDATRARIAALLRRFPGRPTVMLSGGVDSVLVAAITAAAGADLRAVTVATADSVDATAAAAAAAALGVEHHIIWLDDDAVAELARTAAAALGIAELWEVTAAIPILAVRDELTAGPILTGSGADAIIGGGRTLHHPVDSAAAVVELDELIRRESGDNFRRERLVPHFYEALLGDDAPRLVHVFQTARMWRIAERLAPPALFGHHPADGPLFDKFALRVACERLLPAGCEELAWTVKNPVQRSSGIMAALHRAARAYAATLPGATTYSDPRSEPADLLATRLYLANLD